MTGSSWCQEKVCERADWTLTAFFLSTGKILHISDRDYKIAEPVLTSDEYVQSSIGIVHAPQSCSFYSTSAMIPSVRMAESITMALKSHTTTAATLDTYDEHFTTIVSTLK